MSGDQPKRIQSHDTINARNELPHGMIESKAANTTD